MLVSFLGGRKVLEKKGIIGEKGNLAASIFIQWNGAVKSRIKMEKP